MPALASLICGFIFGSGLVISHMVQTTKVLGFLDVFGIPSGTWDPSLIVVMAAGLLVTGIGFALIRPRVPISFWRLRISSLAARIWRSTFATVARSVATRCETR